MAVFGNRPVIQNPNTSPLFGLQAQMPQADVRPGGIGGRMPSPTAGNPGQAAQAQQATYRPDFGVAMTDLQYQQAIQSRGQQQVSQASGAIQGGGPGSAYSVDPSGVSYSVTAPANLGAEKERLGMQSEFAGREREADSALMERQRAAQQAAQAGLAQQQQQSELDFLKAQQGGAQALQQGGFAGQENLLKQRAQVGEGAWQSRLKTIQALPPIDGGQSGSTLPFNEEAARAAAFGRAKEQAGGTANAAIRALQSAMEGRGMTGSTLEAQGMGEIVGGAGGAVNDFTTEQLMADLQRAGQLEDRNYAGGLQRRGQDIAYRNALTQLLSAGPLY